MKITRYMAVLAAILLAIAIAGCANSTGERSETDSEADGSIAPPPTEEDASSPSTNSETAVIDDIESAQDIDLSDVPSKFREDYISAYKKVMADKARATEYLNTALALQKSGEIEGALGYAQAAVNLDANNKQARALAAELLGTLGKTSDTTGKLNEEYLRIRATREYAKREIANHLASGNMNMEAGNLVEAIEDFQEVAKLVSIHRSILDATAMEWEKTARKNLELARDRKRQIDQANIAREADIDSDRLSDILKSEMEKEARTIAQLTEKMERYRSERKFEEALQILDILLVKDRHNTGALHRLRNEILNEYATHSSTITRDRNKTNVERVFQKIEEKKIPLPEIYKFDKAYWASDVEVRAEKIIEEGKMVEISEEDKHVSALVNNAVLETGFTTRSLIGTNIVEIKNYLSRSDIGIEFKVSTLLAQDTGLSTTPLDLHLPGRRSLKSVLNLITEELEIAWEIEDGMVFFKKTDEAGQSKLLLRYYEVGDITRVLIDFKGAEVDMSGDGGDESPTFDSSEEHVSPFEGSDEDLADIEYNIEDLIELIKEVIPPSKEKNTWNALDADPKEPAIWKFQDHRIYVRALPETQEEIDQLITKIRKLWGIMVNIEARFITVEREFLESVGVEWRDVGPVDVYQSGSDMAPLSTQIPNTAMTSGIYYSTKSVDIGVRAEHVVTAQMTMSSLEEGGGLTLQAQLLDAISFEAILKAVRQDANRQLLVAPRITCFNTQQASMFVGVKEPYVKEWSNEGGGGGVAMPTMDFIAESTVFDVRPVVSADRKYVTLFLRPTITFPPDLSDKETNVVTFGDITVEQEVDLPQQEIHKFRTVVMVPDGGTVLISGLSRAEDSHIQSRIPLLHKIPILGFFFKSETRAEYRSQIMILITVRIIIADEMESEL